jgi:hypothetical protein
MILFMSILLHIGPTAAAEYTAPDNAFSVSVPAGWRVRMAPLNGALAGQQLTVIEPANGGEERIVVGAGVAMAASIQELSQQAAALAGSICRARDCWRRPFSDSRAGCQWHSRSIRPTCRRRGTVCY